MQLTDSPIPTTHRLSLVGRSTSFCEAVVPEVHNLEELFHSDIGSQLRELLRQEVEIFKAKLASRPPIVLAVRDTIRKNLQSFITGFPIYNINSFRMLGNTKVDQNFFKRVNFVRIVNEHQLIFFGMIDKTITVFRRDTEQLIVLKTPSKANCLDYDPKSDVFVIGHQEGQISIAKWNGKGFIYDPECHLNYYSDSPVKLVRFVDSIDVIALLSSLNKTMLLLRVSDTKFSYKVVGLMKPLDPLQTYDDLTSTLIQRVSDESGDISRSLHALTVSCLDQVLFMFIEVTREKGKFKGKIEEKKTLRRKLIHPKFRINSESDSKDETFTRDDFSRMSSLQMPKIKPEESFKMNVKRVSQKERCFVVPSMVQWHPESVPSFLVVWENIIERYHMPSAKDMTLTMTMQTKLQKPLISGYFGAVEYFVGINTDLEFVMIHIDKIRYQLEDLPLLSLDTASDVIQFIIIPTVEDKASYMVGIDTESRGLCLFTTGSLEYFSILTLQNYIDNLKARERFIETIKLLLEIVTYGGVPLNGVFSIDSTYIFPGTDFSAKYNEFEAVVRTETASIVTMFLDYLAQTKYEHMKLYTEICLELLLKTHNYDILCNDFVLFIVNASKANPEVANVFFNKLLSMFEMSNLLDVVDAVFFFHLFELARIKETRTAIENFFFFVFKDHKVRNEVVVSLLLLEVSKAKLYDLLFFIYLHDPYSETNRKTLYDAMVTCHSEERGRSLSLSVRRLSDEFPDEDADTWSSSRIKSERQEDDLGKTVSKGVALKDDQERPYDELGRKFLAFIFDVLEKNELAEIAGDLTASKSAEQLSQFREEIGKFFLEKLPFFFSAFPRESCWLVNELVPEAWLSEDTLRVGQTGLFEFPKRKTDNESMDMDVINELKHQPNWKTTVGLFYITCFLRFKKVFVHESFFEKLMEQLTRLFNIQLSESESLVDEESLELVLFKLIFLNLEAESKCQEQLRQLHHIFQLELNSLQMHESALEFFQFVLPKSYLFELLELIFDTQPASKTEQLAEIIFTNKQALLTRNRPRFFKLIPKQPVAYVFKYGDDFIRDPSCSKLFLDVVEELPNSIKFSKSQTITFLRILCACGSNKVISFIESDVNLDYSEKYAICMEFNHLRGMAYSSFKLSEFQRGLGNYKQILKSLIDKSDVLDPDTKIEIIGVLNEMIFACPDEEECERVILETLVFIAANLHDYMFKKERIAWLINRMFKFENRHIINDLRKFGYYTRFVADPFLASTFMSSCRAMATQNDLVLNIMLFQTFSKQRRVIESGKQGSQLYSSVCWYCKKQRNPMSRQVIYHVCGTMIHEVCANQKLNKCPYCNLKNLSLLISDKERKRNET